MFYFEDKTHAYSQKLATRPVQGTSVTLYPPWAYKHRLDQKQHVTSTPQNTHIYTVRYINTRTPTPIYTHLNMAIPRPDTNIYTFGYSNTCTPNPPLYVHTQSRYLSVCPQIDMTLRSPEEGCPRGTHRACEKYQRGVGYSEEWHAVDLCAYDGDF